MFIWEWGDRIHSLTGFAAT